jgi:hypothetical protein
MFLDPFYDPPKEEDYKIWGQFMTGEKKRISQDQDSTHNQLKDLYYVAVKIGKYDAAELIKKQIQAAEVQMDSLKQPKE